MRLFSLSEVSIQPRTSPLNFAGSPSIRGARHSSRGGALPGGRPREGVERLRLRPDRGRVRAAAPRAGGQFALAKLSKCVNLANFANFWRARSRLAGSRLYRSRFLQVYTKYAFCSSFSFAAFLCIFQALQDLQTSAPVQIQDLEKNRFEKSALNFYENSAF